jgi:hypothetical protein
MSVSFLPSPMKSTLNASGAVQSSTFRPPVLSPASSFSGVCVVCTAGSWPLGGLPPKSGKRSKRVCFCAGLACTTCQ